jgi:hypothetical protein
VSTITPITTPATIPPMAPEDKPLDVDPGEEVVVAVEEATTVDTFIDEVEAGKADVERVSASVGMVILNH